MPAIVNNDIRILSANQFLNAFTSDKDEPWVTGTAYTIGDVVYNAFYKYIATTSGTAGGSPPAHITGTVSDGGVDWLYVEQFQNTANFFNNLYITIGNVSPWDNPGVGDETPLAPVDDFSSQLVTLSRVISAKRLESTAVKLAIKRYEWDITGTTVYSQFDPIVAGFAYATPMYVFADNNIYKCLNNNGGTASNTKPTGTSVDPIVTPGDGYTWKYMFSVEAGDALQFLTADYVPVAVKLADDGSNQWAVQANAKAQPLSAVNVTNGGSGYTTATVTVDAPTSGTTATASAVINAGVIESIQLSVVGEGYDTIPNIVITGDGTLATADAVLAPKGGHGSNALLELDARYAIVNARFDDTESGYFPITGESDFRQIAIIVDPLDVNGDDAEAPRYIGADHDDWDGAETSGKSELKKGSGTLLYLENIAPVVRSTGQIEDLKITLKF